MSAKRLGGWILVLLLVAIVAGIALAWRPSIGAIDPPARASFDPALVLRGAQLDALGNCGTCHSAAGGKGYGGGRGFDTPFGRVFSTNISPHPETGIGRWSEQAFFRSMREGVDRDGNHLYPVFPYDHFRIVGDDDLRALYAFLMTRDAVDAQPPANRLSFPFGFRPLLAGWKLLFLPDEAGFRPNPERDADWNRGAYLAEGLGHCGACHTPRNAFGAVKPDEHLAGAESNGWYAPALNAASPAPIPWTRERLHGYLRNQVVPLTDIPAGPMAPVAHNLELVPEQDVAAIATYIASIIGEPSAARSQQAERTLERVRRDEQQALAPTPAAGGNAGGNADASLVSGERIYVGACAICHGAGRGPSSGSAIHLALTTTVVLPTPINLIQVIEHGVTPRAGERGRWMPAYRGALTDAQLTALVDYVRAEFGGGEPWSNVGEQVRAVRQGARAD